MRDEPQAPSLRPVTIDRPVFLYDRDCGFCQLWVAYWYRQMSEQIWFWSFQEAGRWFPQIDPNIFLRSSVFVRPDGSFATGARGVLEFLATIPKKQRLLWCYHHLLGFASFAELVYRLISSHRHFFLHLMLFIWRRKN